MILQALHDLYPRLEDDPSYGIPRPGYSTQKIAFRIVLHPDGRLHAPEDARTPDDKGKPQNTPMEVPGEAKPPGAGINPCFLWDNQTYLLGRQPADKGTDFATDRFAAFRARHLAAEAEIDCPEFSAVCRFLETWESARITEFSLLDDVGTGFGVFQIIGQKQHVHDHPKVRAWWAKNQPRETADVRGQCLITGETDVPLARLHPKIKGVAGAQSSGGSIVSFNDTAYESYAKSQSYNSPVGEDAANRYGAALNALLTGQQSHRHRIRIGDATCVFWTAQRSATEDIFAEILGAGSNAPAEAQDETQRQRIQRFLTALRSGGAFEDDQAPLDTPFFLLGLAPNAARISVRFFHQSTIADLIERLRDHQRCLEMVREYTATDGKRPPDAEFPPIWQLLGQTARVSDEIPPLLGGALARAIVTGGSYPEGLLTAVIRRIHADRHVSYLRAALIKAVLVRNHQQPVPVMLDTTQTDPAYLLGRLFAALEKTQEDALPGINATIRDRFYSAASATPAAVFPRLLRTYQHHLGKLSVGAKISREKQVQDIVSPLLSNGLPTQLSLKAQGIFAIGYYHQRKDFFTKKDQPESAAAAPAN